ncbi:MAG: hypothetical protein GX139_07720 [Armatimonadetes bacterium]|nr:hypothetical protein [Armatimonadota bacterium]
MNTGPDYVNLAEFWALVVIALGEATAIMCAASLFCKHKLSFIDCSNASMSASVCFVISGQMSLCAYSRSGGAASA